MKSILGGLSSCWQEIKKRFDPSTPERYPLGWEGYVARLRQSRPIVRLYGFVAVYYGGPSLYGFTRMLLGGEKVLFAFHDAPDMIHDMMETAADFFISLTERALREAPVTYAHVFEDMCFRGGPLISPSMVAEFMAPRYRRITKAIRKAGVDIIFVDSDGDVEQLIPSWLDSGINGVCPMEQAAGNDIREYRRRFGRRLLMTGGIDKRALAGGRKEIDRELDRRIPLAFEGGYIPHLDHTIPPDVPYEDFMYYWSRKKKMLGI